MSFTAVVTSHENPRGLQYALGNLMYQTRPPDEIIVLASDTPELDEIADLFVDALVGREIASRWLPRENRNDWGHEKRHDGLMLARGEYVGFFNDDDSYDIDYLHKMMASAVGEGADIVYCDWSGVANCTLALGSSTSGNFIVRTELARLVGYDRRDYTADGFFLEALKAKKPRVHKIAETLYFHNTQSVKFERTEAANG